MSSRPDTDPGVDRRWIAPRSSGDLVADRRFMYAQAASAEGDHAAAAELLEQTLELVPYWAPLWLALAAEREKMGRVDDAKAAFAHAAALDGEGELGADLHLARLGATAAPKTAPANYVRRLFDQYADRFEAHLTETLAYRGPDLLAAALGGLCARHFAHAIDLGCGTGLCGARFRASSDRLTGVDLSSRMIQAARAKGIYDRLETGEVVDFLAREPAEGASLVLAADVLVYLGDLAPALAAVRRALAPGGHFAFTLQRALKADYEIGSDMRFSHSEAYAAKIVVAAGLSLRFLEPASTRKDGGVDAPGLVVVAARG